MFLLRKIGSMLRGNATPLQVMLATVFGGLLGFIPGVFLPGDLGGGLLQAPGLILLLLCCVLVLNANLGVFGLVVLLAKATSFLLLPVSYAIGRWMLDGPLQGMFAGLVNGKVTAWFGLEYYATTGGLVTGLLFGVLCGVLLNRSLRALRAHMAGLEQNSERYQKYASKKWVRLLTWLFLGSGKGKASWQDLATQKKVGMPIRIVGVLMAAVLIASVWVFQSWFSTPILTRTVQGALQSMNGATVDLRAARLGLGDGQLLLDGLAIADKKALDKDLLAADVVTATIDTGELLRKRFVIDEVKATNARGGTVRAVPGIVIPGEPAPPEPPAPAGTKTIEDWLADFEVWKGRLAQAQEWIEAIMGGDDTGVPKTPEQRETERIEQEKVGLARVVATHLLEATPRIVIRRIDIEGIGYSIGGKADKFDLRARFLSDAPSLVDEALSFDLKSQSDTMALGLLRPGRSAKGADMGKLGFQFGMKNVAVDSIFGQLKVGGTAPVRGGTMDLAMNGAFGRSAGSGLAIDVPLQVTMKDTTFALSGSAATKVDSLLLPIGLRGPLTKPAVSLDDKVLQDALLAAGQKELANFVQGQAGKLLGGVAPQLQGLVDPGKSVGENADALKAKAEAEAARLAEEAKKKAEEEAKKKLLDEAKKKLPGGLQGLIPGGGDKKKD